MPLFHRYIGIDYSGAATPASPLRGLMVWIADREGSPRQVGSPGGRVGDGRGDRGGEGPTLSGGFRVFFRAGTIHP